MNDELSAEDAAFLRQAKIRPEPIRQLTPRSVCQHDNESFVVIDADGAYVSVITVAEHVRTTENWIREAQRCHRGYKRAVWVATLLLCLVAVLAYLLAFQVRA